MMYWPADWVCYWCSPWEAKWPRWWHWPLPANSKAAPGSGASPTSSDSRRGREAGAPRWPWLPIAAPLEPAPCFLCLHGDGTSLEERTEVGMYGVEKRSESQEEKKKLYAAMDHVLLFSSRSEVSTAVLQQFWLAFSFVSQQLFVSTWTLTP